MIEEIINANNDLTKAANVLKSKVARFINEQTDYGKKYLLPTDYVGSNLRGQIIDILPVDYGETITIHTETGMCTLNTLEIDTLKVLANILVSKHFVLEDNDD